METKKFYFLFGLLPLSLCALPVGEKVRTGSAHFSKQESILQIEASDKAIIDFDSFNIQKGEKVLFVQPKSSSTLLSRVQGSDVSQILGTLSSNGKVFLVNPYGVYFGQDAIVDTGSLIVSTLDVLNEDFLQERYCFFAKPDQKLGEIRNEGVLTAIGGSVALLGPRIVNEGTILADVGQVVLASAEKVTLDFSGDGLMAFAVDGIAQVGGLKEQIALDPSAMQKIVEGVINADGFIVGSELIEKEGIIHLVPSSHIAAKDITISGVNLQVEGSVIASGNLNIDAQEIVCLRDSLKNPLILHAHQQFSCSAPVIDILALDNLATQISSSGPMTFLSNNPISADAHFFAGGNFSLLTPEGIPGDFKSIFDPIITSSGDVSFGSYSGVSLKVQAAGNITCSGTINITGVDASACLECVMDSDCNTLEMYRALILKSGSAPAVMCFQVPPNVMEGGTTFSGTGSPSGSTIFLHGNITGVETAIFDGDVRLQNSVTITGIGTQPITFTGSIDNAGNFNVSNTNGLISFGGNIGSNQPLFQVSATSDVGIEIGGNINTTGSGPLVLTGPVILTNDSVIDVPDNNVTFSSTIDSVGMTPFDLTINSDAGALNFGGDIGSVNPLGNLSASSYNVNSTAGITINADGITFKVSDGLNPLSVETLNAGSTGILLQSVVGINLNANLTTTGGPVDLEGSVIVAENIAINTSGGDLTFSSTIDDIIASGHELTLDTSTGTVTLGDDVGGLTPLGVFSVTAEQLLLESSLTIEASNGITINAPVSDPIHSLTLNASAGIVAINEPISISVLTVTGTTSIELGADIVALNNTMPLAFIGFVVLTDSISILPAQELIFARTVDSSMMGGPFDLKIIGTTANSFVTFEDNIGSINPLGNLSVVNAQINMSTSSITTTGNFDFVSMVGSGVETLTLQIGGTATFGSIAAMVEIEGSVGSLFINGPISVGQINLVSAGSILNLGFPHLITLSDASSFITTSATGTIGTLLNPINVDSTSTITAGTSFTLANFVGTTMDDTIHPDMTFIPCPLLFNGTQIPTTGCSQAPTVVGGVARIKSFSNNAPIAITAGSTGSVELNSGAPSGSTQIVSQLSTLTVQSDSDIVALAGFGNNAYTLVSAGSDLELTSMTGDISFTGGSAPGTYALVTTTADGDITLTASMGSINFTAGSSMQGGNVSAGITTQNDGDISLNALSLNLTGEIGPNPLTKVKIATGTAIGTGDINGTFVLGINTTAAQISTGFTGGDITLSSGLATTFEFTDLATSYNGGEVSISTGGDLTFDSSSIATGAGNVTLNSQGSIFYQSGTFNVTLPDMGVFSAIAGNNMSFDNGSFIHASGPTGSTIQLVVDNNNPMSVGPGSLIYPVGAGISLFTDGFVRIYTSSRQNNAVATGAVINGLLYIPTMPPGVDTNQEVWNTTYPAVPAAPQDGSDSFTIYYKSGFN